MAETDTSKLLEEAEQRAAEVLRSAERRAGQLREQSDALLREAETVKASTMETAEAEADRNLEDARRQYEALQQEIQGLAVHKANALRELGRLQHYLAAAAGDSGTRDAVKSSHDEGSNDADDAVV